MADYGGTATGAGTQDPATDNLGSTRIVQDAEGNWATRMDYAPFWSCCATQRTSCYATPWTSGMMFIVDSPEIDQ